MTILVDVGVGASAAFPPLASCRNCQLFNRTLRPANQQLAIIERHPDNTIHEGKEGGVHRGLSLGSLCASAFRVSFEEHGTELDMVRSVLAAAILSVPPLPLSKIRTTLSLEHWQAMAVLEPIYPLVRLSDSDLPFLCTPSTSCFLTGLQIAHAVLSSSSVENR